MTVRYAIEHSMEFRYSAPVHLSVMTLHLRPAQDRRQVLRNFLIDTDPPGPLFSFLDAFGNTAHFFDRPAEHDVLVVKARSSVDAFAREAVPPRLGAGAWTALRDASQDPDLWHMLNPSRFARPSPVLESFLESSKLAPSSDPLATAHELCAKLHATFEYAPGSTEADSPIERVLETGQGVCQDYAHVMASIARGWGIPCRYVSGYLGPPPGDASRRDGVASGQSHAWVECWFPELGWTPFDPTNDTVGDERHVRVAVGRDYADVPPARGTYQGGAESALDTEVSVSRHLWDPSGDRRSA